MAEHTDINPEQTGVHVPTSETLTIETFTGEDGFDFECDGCGTGLQPGQKYLSGIKSCCGGGCCRALCMDCIVMASATILLEVNK